MLQIERRQANLAYYLASQHRRKLLGFHAKGARYQHGHVRRNYASKFHSNQINMKLHQTLGFYIPAFLHLQVETDRRIDAVNGTEDERTLFHELIHFLQDVTTTYGIINICRTVDVLKDQNRILIESKRTGEIEIPVPHTRYGAAIAANKDLASIYEGDTAARFFQLPTWDTIAAYAKDKMPVILPNGKQVQVPYIEFSHSSIPGAQYQFGSMAVMESMANLLEDEAYRRQSPLLSFPYDTAQLLVSHIYPSLADNRRAIAEICEASLMYYTPGAAFVEAVEQMKKDGFQYQRPDDAYRYVLRHFKMDPGGEAIDEFSNKSALAAKQFDDLFTVPPLSTERWASSVINNGQAFRLKGTTLTSHLWGNQKAIWTLISQIGCPLMFNRKQEAWQQKTGALFTSAAFPAILSIFELLSSGKACCGLQDFCRSTGKVVVDESCDTAPWSRAKDGKHCNFSAIWKMWGLEGVVVKQSH